jgi:CO dehydrogenase maturation factor
LPWYEAFIIGDKLIIAVSGKGGTGKTVFAALAIKILTNKYRTILAIDADPDSNLPNALGLTAKGTIGGLREELLEEQYEIPQGLTKEEFLEYQIRDVMVETKNFDLIVMGRPEGPGCYCWVNNILKRLLDSLPNNYDLTLIDCEAGLEHLSRRTTKDVDIMIVISDPTIWGLETAKKVKKLAKELHIEFKKLYVVVNKTVNGTLNLKRQAKSLGLNVIGFIPFDQEVYNLNSEGKSLLRLSSKNKALRAVKEILEKIVI